MSLKAFFAPLLAIAILAAGAQARPDLEVYADDLDPLFAKYVKPDGVAYRAWHANETDRATLRNVLAKMAQLPLDQLSENGLKAFYINLYNAAMVQIVLEAYPLKSVTDIKPNFGIFTSPTIELGEEKLSLDDVEKGILFKRFDDERVHFAVNCASLSCPPLADTAYRAENLDARLDEQTKAFAQSEHAARIDRKKKRIYYSQLFQWYSHHFETDNPVQYLNRYRSSELPENFAIDWITYDWTLNESEK